MFFNIVDKRKRNEFNPQCDAVLQKFEMAGENEEESDAEWMGHTTVDQAVRRAQGMDCKVTIFIYDPGYVIEQWAEVTWLHPQISQVSTNGGTACDYRRRVP